MNKPLVSIIVPVYNTKRYLNKCIDSILNQTLKNIEIICVDDGSNDGSAEILDNYAQEDNRLRIIHKSHAGLVAARRDGVFAAQSRYIGFVDSDDWIETQMYEELYEFIEREGVDCVFSDIYMESLEPYIKHNGFCKNIYKEEELVEVYSHLLDYDFCSPHTVAKIYKRDILRTTCIGIDERIHFGEDDCLVYSYLIECRSIGFIKKAYYHCIIREGSDSKTFDCYYLMKMNIIYLFLKGRFEKSQYKDIMLPQLEFYLVRSILYGLRGHYELGISNYFETDFIFKTPKKIVIYGAGSRGRKLMRMIKKENTTEIIGIIDKNLFGKTVDGVEISSIYDITKMEYDFVMITVGDLGQVNNIKEQLLKLGVQKNKIRFFELYV